MNNFPRLSVVTRVTFTVALIAVTLIASTCGSESPRAAPSPNGAVAGQNTFIYVYSDT